MVLTLLTLAAAAVFFVWGKIRADVVALIALMVLAGGGVLTVQEAFSGFSNPIVIMMAGLFVVGGAVFNSGLAKMIGARLSALGGNSPTRLFLVVVLATGIIGGFVSNTGTVALMMPIVVAMATASAVSPARFLMPIAKGSGILRNVSQEAPTAASTVDSGDTLFVRGSKDGVRRFVIMLAMIVIFPF